MKALVIAPQPFFQYRGTPFSVYYRTLVLAEQGVEVDFVTYGQGMDVEIPGVKIHRIPAFRWLGPVKIGPSILKLFLDIFLFSKSIWMLLRHRYAFVHAHEEAVFFCAMIKPIFRFKLIYDMHSSLPQQLENFQFSSFKPLLKLFDWLERLSIKRAEAVITICPDLRDYVLKLIDRPEKHFLIENSIFEPVKLLRPDDRKPPAAETAFLDGLPVGKKRIVYAGTLEAYQGIELLVNAFNRLIQERDDCVLVIVGGTPEQVAKYRALLSVDAQPHAFLHPRVTQLTAKTLCASAELLASPRSSGTNTPLKIYELLAGDIPIVATRIYSHTQILTDETAYLADPEPAAICEALLAALRDGRENNPKVAAAKALYAAEYSRPVYEEKMRALLKGLNPCAE